ncbi:MAG: phosphoribosylformylglycinamidine synthase [Chloroflexi bacterium]|nr:phosphoribosylformylglycinamidine synthase [Chloroflexota bacterium]|tara:strand:- start:125 stop:379 length:255 start_codon:yes stop_codon:yes gene_type:complete
MKNYTVNIKITPLKAVNDPRGTQVMNGLENLGYSNLNNVSVGKYIVISIKAQNKEECENMIKKACEDFLSNPLIEEYSLEINEN